MSKHYNQYVYKRAVWDAVFVGCIATRATMCDYLPNSRHNKCFVDGVTMWIMGWIIHVRL